MNRRKYVRDNFILIIGMLFVCVATILTGRAFKVSYEFYMAIVFLVVMVLIIYLVHDYGRKKVFYNNMESCLNSLDQKYLITEMIKKPNFTEGEIFIDILYEIDKSMKDRINDIEMTTSEFKDYLELWIHEIKVPISALKLMNYNENTDPAKEKQQIDKINYYVEQILFYARAGAAEKDYLLKECNVETIINKMVMEHKAILMGNKIHIEKEDVNVNVITDSKWLEYMISQIINNASKYAVKDRNSYIKFSSKDDDETTTIIIEDNGMGISEKDLPYVFDKTFTGENGRKSQTSTGMGLYVCKKLCDKLGHRINIESTQGEYTRVKLTFGKDKFIDIE